MKESGGRLHKLKILLFALFGGHCIIGTSEALSIFCLKDGAYLRGTVQIPSLQSCSAELLSSGPLNMTLLSEKEVALNIASSLSV